MCAWKLWIHAYLHTIGIGSKKKVSLTKNNSKTQLNKRNTYLFKMLFIILFISIFSLYYVRLPHIIKEVNIIEELYSQQLIYLWRSNPEPRKKLSLIIFPSLWFFKTPTYKDWNNLKESKHFLSRCCTKAVSNIDEKNQWLKLLLVTLDVKLVVGLDL